MAITTVISMDVIELVNSLSELTGLWFGRFHCRNYWLRFFMHPSLDRSYAGILMSVHLSIFCPYSLLHFLPTKLINIAPIKILLKFGSDICFGQISFQWNLFITPCRPDN